MRLGELLPREHIIAPLAARSLRTALEALVSRLAELGRIGDQDALAAALAGQRARDIVCIGPRVALPHFRTGSADRRTLALGGASEALDPEGLANEAAPRIVVLILAPPSAASSYLQVVSALARVFRDAALVERILGASTPDQVMDATRTADLQVLPKLTVRDIMSQDVRPVSPATPIREAVDLLVRKRLRALPVVGEKDEVLGSISERDIMRGLLPRVPRADLQLDAAGVELAEHLTVRDVMTRSVMCVSEDLSLEEAANLMINKDVEQLPVTCEGKLTGFLTRGDLIRKLFAR
ncbi:MAG: CBS domain-containing protein [Gemmatimonadetes bacterium]|nr:CBS domain-containing protein [Gemmatimonadota bacterium]